MNAVALCKFSVRLKLLMLLTGEENKHIVDVLGCKNARVTNLRCAATKPTDKELMLLAEHFDVPVEFLDGTSRMIINAANKTGQVSQVFADIF